MTLIILAAISNGKSYATQEASISSPNFWNLKSGHTRPNQLPSRIQFLATDDFPPFVFRDPEDRLTGFNVDLARALCQELQVSCSLRIKKFEDLLVALEEEEGDAIIAGLARAPEMASRLAFSDDYLKLPARFVSTANATDGLVSVPDLKDKQVSVEAGSRHAVFAGRFFPEAQVIEYSSLSDARAAVASGDVDYHFGDGLSLSFWLQSAAANDCCAFSGGPWLEPGYFDSGLAIATRRDDQSTLDALNYGLYALYKNGKYQELYLRYFPLSFY
ncbi:transporter substrate-binding domain-containing protein [Roseibium sp. RKSG952]|uniref:transporter substrate-binding domain-containing protein n=1 Tax=Roseibium sp. RKSG952 TaxID=2529384 RepID=UPI0034CD96BE